LEVEFVGVGDDLHGELWLVGHMKSSAGEVSPIVVVEQDLRDSSKEKKGEKGFRDQLRCRDREKRSNAI
jgi:hypothetical protein